MELARIALIAAVCFADGALLFGDWNRRVHRWPAVRRWIESIATRFESPNGSRWARSSVICQTPGSARP
jgi:hypothetical protein